MTPDPRWQTVRDALGQFSFQATNPYLADAALAALDSLEAENERLDREHAAQVERNRELHKLGAQQRAAMEARAEKAEAERDEYRFWNERVRVCSEHTSEIADGSTDCLVCENERLRDELEGMESMRTLAERRVEELEAALREFLDGMGVEFDDPRMKYVVMQVGRRDLEAARAALGGEE